MRDGPVHCRMLSVPGLYSLDTNITPKIITIKKCFQMPRHTPWGMGGGREKFCLAENHWLRVADNCMDYQTPFAKFLLCVFLLPLYVRHFQICYPLGFSVLTCSFSPVSCLYFKSRLDWISLLFLTPSGGSSNEHEISLSPGNKRQRNKTAREMN